MIGGMAFSGFGKTKKPLGGLFEKPDWSIQENPQGGPFQFDPIQMSDALATGGVLAAPAPGKPSFFGEGGTGRAIAGHIGDALLQMNRMDPIYAPAMAGRQRAAMMQQQAEAQRQAEWQDWLAKKNWELANPAPRAPYRWEANNGSLMEVGPDGQPRVVYEDPTPKIEYFNVRNPDGTMTITPMVQGRPSGPPVGTVKDGYRFKGGNPNDPNAWEHVGGATPPGSRSFP